MSLQTPEASAPQPALPPQQGDPFGRERKPAWRRFGGGILVALAAAAGKLKALLLLLPKLKVLTTSGSMLVSVAAVGILFGGFAILLAVPFAAVLATLVDVVLLDKDPAEEEVPTVLFPAKDAEA